MRSSVFAITLVALLLCSGVAWSVCPCTVTGTVDVPDQDCDEITLQLWQRDNIFFTWSMIDSGVYEDDEAFSLHSEYCGGGFVLRLKWANNWVTDIFQSPIPCDDTLDVGTVTIPADCPGGKEPPESEIPMP